MNYKLLMNPIGFSNAVKRKFVRAGELRAIVKAGEKRFAGNSAYCPDDMHLGFAPRGIPETDDTALLLRICDAYIKAKELQVTASETYKVSNEWLPIYERPLRPVMRALASRDIGALRAMYRNFYRDPCSTGLAGLPINMAKHYFQGSIQKKYRHLLLCDCLHRHELWKRETENSYPLQDLVSPDIGNPYGFFIDGVFLKHGSDYLHYYASKIRSLLPSSTQQIVAELGGGFGGMAFYLIRDNPKVTYIDFDLPENLALASYYLLKAFPDIPAVLFGEADLTPQVLSEARIVMMPSFEIGKLQDQSVAISFNSYSLAEMSRSSIAEYIEQIARISSSYFMHVNHTRNAVVTADDFGVEQHGLTLIERRVAAWNLGTIPHSDEFQFLYQASDDKAAASSAT